MFGMFGIGALAFYVWVAAKTTSAISREREVFTEFGQSDMLKLFIWLYPIPFVVGVLPSVWLHLLVFGLPVSALCFVPGMVLAHTNRQKFETAGTDRVDRAERAVSMAIWTGLVGIIYVVLRTLLFWFAVWV